MFFRLFHKIPISECFLDNVAIALAIISMTKPACKPLSIAKVLDYRGESAVIMNGRKCQSF